MLGAVNLPLGLISASNERLDRLDCGLSEIWAELSALAPTASGSSQPTADNEPPIPELTVCCLSPRCATRTWNSVLFNPTGLPRYSQRRSPSCAER